MDKKLIPLLEIFILLFVFTSSCVSRSESPEIDIKDEYWPSEEWRTSTPEEQGVDTRKLVDMIEYIDQQDITLDSLLIIKNGFLITEIYWQPYGRDDPHTIESITKPIIGTLIGIAVDKGVIENVDQQLGSFFSELELTEYEARKITIENLLTMTPGLDCSDDKIVNRLEREADWMKYFFNIGMVNQPGKTWVYCSAAPHLLSAILQESTGMGTNIFAYQNLFKPLGIPQERAKNWKTDPQGITNGIQGLYLTPIEIARFGYLYLKVGKWGNQQLMSENWVQDAVTSQIEIGRDEYTGGRNREFGYLWSIFPDEGYYGFLGMAGQGLFIHPGKNLVVVFTGSLEVGKEARILDILEDFILPSVISTESNPDDPAAQAEMATYIRMARGIKKPFGKLPDIAGRISDHTYQLEKNPYGWSKMEFHFEPGEQIAILKMTESPALEIGLDNMYRVTKASEELTIGLRGKWTGPDIFEIDYLIFGDFIRSKMTAHFMDEEIILTIRYLNWSIPPIIIKGSSK